MIGRRNRRGAALLWAILLTSVVATAVAAVASGLSDRARLVRVLERRGRLDELALSAATWSRYRTSVDPSWSGAEKIPLGRGWFEVERRPGDDVVRAKLVPGPKESFEIRTLRLSVASVRPFPFPTDADPSIVPPSTVGHLPAAPPGR